MKPLGRPQTPSWQHVGATVGLTKSEKIRDLLTFVLAQTFRFLNCVLEAFLLTQAFRHILIFEVCWKRLSVHCIK